jgi:hypothetical protein
MQRDGRPGTDRNAGDFWLTVPQAVYLEATRDIETAVKLTQNDPKVLVVDVMLRLSRVSIPDDEHVGRREAKEAVLRALNSKRGRYGAALRKLREKLIAGLVVKGRRGPRLPLELIDPAEFTGLELSGVNAGSRTTGEVVWYDLQISAQAQVESLARETQFEPWEGTGDQLAKLLEWAPTTCGGDLDKLPSRDELLRLHRKRFGSRRGISQPIMREVRQQLASERSKQGGLPTHRR